MSQINESPSNGRATEAFRIPFAVWGALRYICLTRDKLSIPENYPNLSNVRPNPCEHSVFGSLIFKKDQILFEHALQRAELLTYPLSAATDITGNGDGWKNKYRPLAVLGPMSGKWGSYTFNLTTGRE